MYLLLSSENGQMGGILIGIVTSRDIDFVHEPDLLRPIKEVRYTLIWSYHLNYVKWIVGKNPTKLSVWPKHIETQNMRPKAKWAIGSEAVRARRIIIDFVKSN